MRQKLPLYVLKEVLPWFVGGVVLFLSLQITNNIASTLGLLLAWRASLGQVFVLLGYQMPALLNNCLVLSVPFALLLAFGRLAKDSEFKAAMAGGVRPLALLLPLAVPALLVGALAYYNAGWLTPAGQAGWTQAWYGGVYKQAQPPPTTDQYAYAQGDTFFSAGRVQNAGPEQAQLYGVLVVRGDTTYSAQAGQWDAAAHTWTLQGGSVVGPDGRPGTLNTPLVLTQNDVLRPPDTKLNETSTPVLRQRLAEVQRGSAQPSEAGRLLAFELSRRVSDPFTPLVFVLAAGALGLLISNRAWAAASVILFIFGFYVLWSTVPSLAQAGALSPTVAAWLPNAAFLLLGGALAWRLR